MKQWDEISENAKTTMKSLGNFGPTVHADAREVKGYTYEDGEGCKQYLSSDDLRRIAAGCEEVAAWLDERASDKDKRAARALFELLNSADGNGESGDA